MAGPGNDLGSLANTLAGAQERPDIAAVLLRLLDGEADLDRIAAVKTVAPAVQGLGAALLLDGNPNLLAAAGADGAHFDGFSSLQAALGGAKPSYIAGAGGLASRHDAMLAGEAGADYVMFGEPDPQGKRPALGAVLERVSWWSEIFELPCVGYAGNLEELSAIAQAGAEFVALGDGVWNHASGPATALAAAADRLRGLELV
jgi:thiamine-phosphate pyrophosphorylase